MIQKISEKVTGNKTVAIIFGPLNEVKDVIKQMRSVYHSVYITATNSDTGFMSVQLTMFEQDPEETNEQLEAPVALEGLA